MFESIDKFMVEYRVDLLALSAFTAKTKSGKTKRWMMLYARPNKDKESNLANSVKFLSEKMQEFGDPLKAKIKSQTIDEKTGAHVVVMHYNHSLTRKKVEPIIKKIYGM